VCAAVPFLLPASPAFATPFETNIPGVATDIEINPQMEHESKAGETSTEFLLEAITPLRQGMELSVEQGYVILKDDTGRHTGFADLEIATKTRLLNGEDNSLGITLGAKPTLSLPTGNKHAGISDHTWGLELPVYVGRKFGGTGVYFEGFYEHVFDRHDDEYGFSGLVLHELWDGLEIGAELASKIPGGRSGDYTLTANAGVLWEVNDLLEIQALAGRTVRTPDGRPVTDVKVEFSFHPF
jgi:hypothetical protein